MSEHHFPESSEGKNEFNPNDKLILVMGVTGAGKSTVSNHSIFIHHDLAAITDDFISYLVYQ